MESWVGLGLKAIYYSSDGYLQPNETRAHWLRALDIGCCTGKILSSFQPVAYPRTKEQSFPNHTLSLSFIYLQSQTQEKPGPGIYILKRLLQALEMTGQSRSHHTGEAQASVLCQLSFLTNREHRLSHLSYLVAYLSKWQQMLRWKAVPNKQLWMTIKGPLSATHSEQPPRSSHDRYYGALLSSFPLAWGRPFA